MKDFKYEIREHVGTVSSSEDGRFAVEVNLISYNDSPVKVDIRRWDKETGRMRKGIAMTKKEAETLGLILQGMKKERGNNDRETETIC